MNLLQQHRHNIFYVTLDRINNTDASILDQMPKFTTYRSELLSIAERINEAAQQQIRRIGGFRMHKEGLREKTALQAVNLARRIVGYAVNTDDDVLEKEMGYCQSDFDNMAERDVVHHTELVIKAATELGDKLGPYGITPEMITQLEIGTAEFEAFIPQTRIQIAERKKYTATIAKLFRQATKVLAKMDRLVGMLEHSEPEFFMVYRLSRHTIKPGYGKLALKGIVIDQDGNPLEGVSIEIDGFKTLTSSDKGNFQLKRIPAGDYTVSCTLGGYEELIVFATINKTSRADLEIILSRKLRS